MTYKLWGRRGGGGWLSPTQNVLCSIVIRHCHGCFLIRVQASLESYLIVNLFSYVIIAIKKESQSHISFHKFLLGHTHLLGSSRQFIISIPVELSWVCGSPRFV